MFRVGVQSSGLGLHVGVPVTLVLVPWDAGLRVKYKDLLTRFRNPAMRSLGYSDPHTSSEKKTFIHLPKPCSSCLGPFVFRCRQEQNSFLVPRKI